MKPLFSKDELAIFRRPKTVRLINQRLSLVRMNREVVLRFKDIVLRNHFLHIGPGAYTTKHIPGKHRHPELQLEYVLSGNVEFDLMDRKIVLTHGQGVLIPPDITHTWHARQPSAMLGAFIDISGESHDTLLKEIAELTAGRNAPLHSDQASLAAHRLFSLLSIRTPPPGYIEEASAWLNMLMIEILRPALLRLSRHLTEPATEEERDQRSKQLAKRAMHFLEANFDHPITLRDVALDVGVSTRHVSRLFMSHYGHPIAKTLTRIRLEHALAMLREHPQYSIKAIGMDCGFQNAAYFSRAFRHAYGFPPTQIQRD